METETVEQFIERLDARLFRFDKWLTYYGSEVFNFPEKRRACYVLFVRNEVVYVGQTSNAKGRLGAHYSQIFGKYRSMGIPEDELYCKIKYPQKYGYEAMLEKRLIRRLQPILNLALKRANG